MLNFKDHILEEEKSFAKNVMSRIKKTEGGHWELQSPTASDGFKQIAKNGVAKQAHRVVWELKRGKIPAGKILLHHCGKRTCVNPAHMTVGTSKENNKETWDDGRGRNQHTPTRTAPGTPKDRGVR